MFNEIQTDREKALNSQSVNCDFVWLVWHGGGLVCGVVFFSFGVFCWFGFFVVVALIFVFLKRNLMYILDFFFFTCMILWESLEEFKCYSKTNDQLVNDQCIEFLLK